MIGENSQFESLPQVLIGPQQDYTLQKTSFRILLGMYCYNIVATCTPQRG